MSGDHAAGSGHGGEGESTPLFDQIVGRHGWPLADESDPDAVAGEVDEPGEVAASAAAATQAEPVRQ
ncbi:hypothetical protein DI005_22875 [Prauserella sp. PE36]|uniref:hypothetical protein n=1 Tax=Prauserella sp. PE36 TaxID=1504709 RepID=UPI000DE5517A|nr:hypothetical protein [Prauserella sp. PE36]RBM17139.1 hypothetical protein DI005_22875 [Prauserella sp. PE36]